MYIFYDFETSSREVLGQILSYSFVGVDTYLEPQISCNGFVKLNPTECPEMGAILTNKLSLKQLEEEGISEYETAKKIHQFLATQIQTYKHCTLVGYNSNSFDLSFLRNLFIRHGLNPYFMGKLANLDILHFTQHIAFNNSDTFKWTAPSSEKNYFSFTLEDISKAHGILAESQTHSAVEDVLLLIKLTTHLIEQYKITLSEFQAVKFPEDFKFPYELRFAKQKTRHFPEESSTSVEKYLYHYWLVLFVSKKSMCLLNLEKYQQLLNSNPTTEKKLSCVKYINANKHFCILESLNETEIKQWSEVKEKVRNDAFFQGILTNPPSYFEMIKKDWDIQYQIHELGFERIDGLNALIQKLGLEPDSYYQIIQDLMGSRTSEKDTYLIQLFNRFYLNNHPDVPIEHAKRYLTPRYITGTYHRNKEDFTNLQDQLSHLNDLVADKSISEQDRVLCKELLSYFNRFIDKYQLIK